MHRGESNRLCNGTRLSDAVFPLYNLLVIFSKSLHMRIIIRGNQRPYPKISIATNRAMDARGPRDYSAQKNIFLMLEYLQSS